MNAATNLAQSTRLLITNPFLSRLGGLATLVLGLAFASRAAETRTLSRDQLLFFTDAAGSVQPVKSTNDWALRRASILKAMQDIMGPLPSPEKRCPLDIQIEGEVDCGSFVRRALTYQAEPGSRVPAFLLIPKSALQTGRKAPAMLALHQTRAEGQKVVVGLGNSPDDEYGVELANRGYVCLAPPYTLLSNYQVEPQKFGYISGTMMAIWNNIRGVDLLQSLAYVRPDRIGAIGHSLGAHNSVFTAVFDERIRAVVASCGLDSFRDYYDGDPRNWAPGRGWCQVRYMPRLADYQGRLDQIPFDFAELLGAIAPRAVFINAPIGDDNFRWRSVHHLTGQAREVFALHGVSSRLRVEHPDSRHRFPPETRMDAYRFLDQVLRD